MKRIVLFLIFLLLAFSVFAEEKFDYINAETTDPPYTIKYDKSDETAKDKLVTREGEFTVTFKGASYTDIGFSKSQASIATDGLKKTEIANNRIEMTRETSTDGKYHCSCSFFIYWYLSLTSTMKLKLTVENNYPKDNTVTLTKDGSELTDDVLATFNKGIAVYFDSYEINVSAVLGTYPANRTVATLKLSLVEA